VEEQDYLEDYNNIQVIDDDLAQDGDGGNEKRKTSRGGKLLR
jgi:hypothetical protein